MRLDKVSAHMDLYRSSYEGCCLKKVSFLESKMGQKSTQERTKNRSIFKTNYNRLPGAILVENDVQLGAKNGGEKKSETSSRTSHRKSEKKCKK